MDKKQNKRGLENIEELYKKLLIKNKPSIKNEEDLKIHFTAEIKNFFDDNNLPLSWSFEHQLKSKKRLDALVNNRTIIELKKPNYFSLQTNIDKTRKKLKKNILIKRKKQNELMLFFMMVINQDSMKIKNLLAYLFLMKTPQKNWFTYF